MTTRNEKTSTTSKRSTRVKRTPLSGGRDILTVEGKDPNYVYRWILDKDNRINQAIEGDWMIVKDEDLTVGDKAIKNSTDGSSSAVTKDVGAGRTCYLMKIKKEFYTDDQDTKQARIDRAEQDMKRELNKGGDGTYGSVKFS